MWDTRTNRNELQLLRNSIFDLTNIRVEPQVINTTDGCVVALKIPSRRRGHVVCTKKGKYLTRSGASLRGMTLDEIAGILAENGPVGDPIEQRIKEVELSINLQTGHSQWCILQIENHSTEQVLVEQVILKKGEIELAPPVRVVYLLLPGRQGPLGWKPEKDPITALDLLVPPENYAGLPPPFVTTIEIVLVCRILERKKSFSKSVLVQVDVVNRSMRQI